MIVYVITMNQHYETHLMSVHTTREKAEAKKTIIEDTFDYIQGVGIHEVEVE